MSNNGSAARTVFRFGEHVLDLGRGSLATNGCAITLRPKSFKVLLYLVENAGRLAPKDEIMGAVWPGIVVTDESLAKCVSEVRLALGDSEQQLIKTVPRRGYLLDVAVSEVQTGPNLSPNGAALAIEAGAQLAGAMPLLPRSGVHRRWLAAATAAGLVGLLGLIAFFWIPSGQPRQQGADRASIAVLPFGNLGDPQHDYFADGIAEDLTTNLGKFSRLFVIGRNSAFSYRGRHVDDAQMGRELGTRYLIEGSVRRDGGKVRVTAALIEAATGAQLWADSYDRELNGIFAVQDAITREIVGRLVAEVTRAELDRARSKPPQNLAAYDYYLQGNALIEARQGKDRGKMVAAAREFFNKALEADPRYASAVEGLAYTYAVAWLEITHYGPFRREHRQSETLDRALALARQAIELDPYLAKGHATLAWVLHWLYRRNEALAEFQRATELNPNLVDVRFAQMLAHDGRAAEALQFLKRALRQDPFPPPIYLSYLGIAYYLTGDYEAARRTLESAAERLPGYRPVSVWLAAAAAQSGHDDEAHTAIAKAVGWRSDLTIAKWLEHIRFASVQDAVQVANGLRRAGLPD